MKIETSPGYASRPGGLLISNDNARYATACLDKSSYTIRTSLPCAIKYSAIAQPVYGEIYCKGAVSDADADTITV